MTIPDEGRGKDCSGRRPIFATVFAQAASAFGDRWGQSRRTAFAGGVLALTLVLFGGGGLASAARLAQIYPDLVVDPGSRRYDYPKAQAEADRLLMTLRHLSGYGCLSHVFFSLKRIRGGGRGAKSGPRPNESFDLRIHFSPLSVSVLMHYPRKGSTVRYSSVEGVVAVRPLGFLPLSLSLSPKSSLITSRFGHTIDHADFLSYERRVLRPACLTHSCLYLGSGRFSGRPVGILGIAPDQLEARPVFGRMWLLLDRKNAFPLSVATEGPDGGFWERVDYLRCQLFPAGEKKRPGSP